MVSIIIQGCVRHQIGYDLKKEYGQPIYKSVVALSEFIDQRPEEERIGKSKEFLAFSSKDKHFTQPVHQAIAKKLKEELIAGGVRIVSDSNNIDTDYRLSGDVVHFQTVVKLPKTTVVPYLGTVSSLWTSDEFVTAVAIQAQLWRREDNRVIFDKLFTVSEDLKLKTGPLNLARFGRGLGYKLKLLDLALENVLKQIKTEVINVLKEVK